MATITPYEMRNGKVTSVHISPNNEIIEITPIGLNEIDSIKETIDAYYDAKDLYNDTLESMRDAEARLNTVKINFDKLSPHIQEREIMSSPPKSIITDVIIDKPPEVKIIAPSPPTPQTEAQRLFNDGIHNTIRTKGRNFNETELSLEIAKSVPQDMVAATTTELISLLQANNIIKTKGRLHSFISSIFNK